MERTVPTTVATGPARAALDAAIAALSAAPPSVDAPITETVLPNGLRVLVLEDHRAPVAAHSLWYGVGSIDERSGVTGIAHVLEHMMFNGTHRYGPGEYDQQMRALGAYTNAMTWTDYTAYTIEAPADQLATIMALEAERMTDLNITDAEFEREIRVVMEERRQSSDDDPAGQLYENLYASAFHASPQRWPIIGWMSDLQTMQADDVRQWYRQWYRPENAVLVVAGDVNPDAVFALALRHFGAIARLADAQAPRRRAQSEPQQRGARRIESRAHTPTAQIAIGFKVPHLSALGADTNKPAERIRPRTLEDSHEYADNASREGAHDDIVAAAQQHIDLDSRQDVFALAILAELLDWGRTLEGAVVRQKRLADETWASYDYLVRSPGLFIIGAVCAQDVTPARVERALRAVVAGIARDGVSDGALSRVRTQMMSARLYRADSVFEQADELGRLAMLGLSSDARAIDARLAAVTGDQIKDVAARYFGDDTMTVAILLPDDAEEDAADDAVEDHDRAGGDSESAATSARAAASEAADHARSVRSAESENEHRATSHPSSMSRNGRDF